jgi:hypothetical protein
MIVDIIYDKWFTLCHFDGGVMADVITIKQAIERGVSLSDLVELSGGEGAVLSPASVPLSCMLMAHHRVADVFSLLRAGADVNAKSMYGTTLLKMSIQMGRLDLSSQLIALRASFFPEDKVNEMVCALNSKNGQSIDFVVNHSDFNQLSEKAFLVALERRRFEFISSFMMKYRGDVVGLRNKIVGRAKQKGLYGYITEVVK